MPLVMLLSVLTEPASLPLGFKPHIIMMLADDLGWNNVGWRNPELKTPVLDGLHGTGVDLQRLYTYKYCSPSRSSLMSGRLPLHVTQNNKNNDVTNAGGADLRMTLLPQRLKAAGYRTAMSGKWHVGARSVANLPINRGFDSHFGFLKGGEDHLTQRSTDEGVGFVDLWRDDGPAFGENGTFSTYIYAREAIRVIDEHAQLNAREAAATRTPLFLYLAWHAVHTPLEVPSDRSVAPVHDGNRCRATMNALVEMLDEGVGNVTHALRRSGLWATSLVIFHADNGGWTQSLGMGT
jgi:arylsulfatase A-like enzyme